MSLLRVAATASRSGRRSASNVMLGGTVALVDVEGVIYREHTFTESGVLTAAASPIEVQWLCVGAGGPGGGGSSGGGGGGAGGYRSHVTDGTLTISADQVIVIGASSGTGSNGSPSSIGDLVTSLGGGYGARYVAYGGGDGGSGGGSARSSVEQNFTGGSGTAGQGNDGYPTALTSGTSSGGGGGASAAGTLPNGGAGTAWIDGVTYAGGGGGVLSSTLPVGGVGGDGGGGAGAGESNADNGAVNTGGGGGGGRASESSIGIGGTGIVKIRYVA